jgi:uncharacterized membrane protein YphA (DoxX/SURF4 family)
MDPRAMLRLGYGLVPIVAGADKFGNLLTDWEQYLSPAVKRTLPMSPKSFMKLVGVIEIAAGLTVLSPLRKSGAYLVAAWLAGITVNLLSTGEYFDIAARDALLAVGALSLAQLEQRPQPALQELTPAVRKHKKPQITAPAMN